MRKKKKGKRSGGEATKYLLQDFRSALVEVGNCTLYQIKGIGEEKPYRRGRGKGGGKASQAKIKGTLPIRNTKPTK